MVFWLSGSNLPAKAGAMGLIPNLGRPVEEGNGTKPMAKPILNGINKPTDLRSSVEEKSLKIPDFLQRNK